MLNVFYEEGNSGGNSKGQHCSNLKCSINSIMYQLGIGNADYRKIIKNLEDVRETARETTTTQQLQRLTRFPRALIATLVHRNKKSKRYSH